MSNRVSVVMSVYKEKLEWIIQSVESILNQTFADFEFIIICDNPEYADGIKLLKEFESKDNRIKLVLNEENIGLTKSLNRGIGLSNADYIVRMDADDISMPNRIEKQVKFMDDNMEVVASGTGAFQLRGRKEKLSHRKTKDIELRSRLIFDSPIYHPSAIIRRLIDGNLVQYDESFRYSQDYALWISLMEKHQIANIDEPLIKYRISDQQISTAKHEEQNVYALRNQKNAMRMIGINLLEKDHVLFQDYTRHPEIHHNKNDIDKFLIDLMKQVKNKKNLDYSVIADHVMLIYINRLSKEFSLIESLYYMFLMNVKIDGFSFYNFFSLFSKYLRR